MYPKFKSDEVVYWLDRKSKYVVKEFQPTNGIGGAYWLKPSETGYDAVASETDMCYIGELFDKEKIILKILECMFPELDLKMFKDEFVKNDYKVEVKECTCGIEYGTKDFMDLMYCIIEQKYRSLVYKDYVEDEIISNICNYKFVGLYTYACFDLWVKNGMKLPFPYKVLKGKLKEMTRHDPYDMDESEQN